MTSTIDIQAVQQKMLDKLEPSGWDKILSPYIMGAEFGQVLQHLSEVNDQGFRFTPPLRNLLRAFELCPYDALQMVFVGKEPYNGFIEGTEDSISDGIAFSCALDRIIRPELDIFFRAIQTKVYPNQEYKPDPGLSRWSNQGVLLIHSALTVLVGYPGSHIDLWKGFTSFLIHALSREKEEIAFVFLGKHADHFVQFVDISRHYAYNPPYPQPGWIGDYIFQHLNGLWVIKGRPVINW